MQSSSFFLWPWMWQHLEEAMTTLRHAGGAKLLRKRLVATLRYLEAVQAGEHALRMEEARGDGDNPVGLRLGVAAAQAALGRRAGGARTLLVLLHHHHHRHLQNDLQKGRHPRMDPQTQSLMRTRWLHIRTINKQIFPY